MSEHHVDPTREQFDKFKQLDRDHPIFMLNQVRLRNQACYPEDHRLVSANITGADAYRLYGEESGPIFKRVGGEIVWRGHFEAVLTGPADEHWDLIFIARYPTAHAFLEMVTDPDYRVAVVHRQAAVDTSRLIRLSMAEAGKGFAV
ncbi:MAG: DUF1330 domain-containing protein [Halieaceae bacterium]|jgi:uncharacterized protein (DUF1330 family)|nr:DUF1330 domain-containing protein [Halieaceae bacterium]